MSECQRHSRRRLPDRRTCRCGPRRGDGVPEQLLQNIFEPYVSSKARGTGLGLAIVKKIVEEHNGVVTLRNNQGQGAVAIIRLPLDKEPAANDLRLVKDAV